VKDSLITKIIIALSVCSVLIYCAIFSFEERLDILPLEEGSCSYSIEEKIVRGNSLTGLVEDGQTVKVLFNYYQCDKIKREDIVLYDYAGSQNPLIKIVKGIPGDSLFLLLTEGGAHIIINEEVLKNSNGQPYLISGEKYDMLALYEKDYQGVIPPDSYLILGNLAEGSIDSTHYGLVHKNNILGKVLLTPVTNFKK